MGNREDYFDEDDKKELENNNEILPVWFNACRYEREKYLVAIPFIREIRITLENEFRKKVVEQEITHGWITIRK